MPIHTPVMSTAEGRQHAAFTAMMWALSYPGRPQRLPAGGRDAFALIGETLVDLETGYFSPDASLAAALARTGGRALPPPQAPYQLYPQLDEARLDLLAAAPVGTYADPDLGATLVIGCALGAGPALTLRGPGIPGAATLRLGGIPAGLWPLRARAVYPLGWDLLFVSGDQLVGLPRTTSVEVR
jgi:alpha-D-ribose 1-methylphosphonate 5-triphosphate synthase subunit PhnH